MKTSSKFTALIVDDEADACNNLSYILHHHAENDINVIGAANNTHGAEILIQQHHPDVVFLDIDMPVENAFQFLERIYPVDFEVVFITAYDIYAIKAFKLNAIDYIVKPVDFSEIVTAVGKIKEKLLYKRVFKQYAGYSSTILKDISARRKQQYITLRDNNIIEVVEFDSVLFIEAKASYSKVVFLKNGLERSVVMSYSIAEYEELLPGSIFYRVHKSYLLNCSQIDRIIKEEIPYVQLKNKLKLPIGRRRYSSFLYFLKNNGFTDV